MKNCCDCMAGPYDPLSDVLSHTLDSGRERRTAQAWAATAKSWAVGDTGIRAGEETDNAKYYAGQAAGSASAADTAAGAAAASTDAAAGAAMAAAGSAGAAKTSQDAAGTHAGAAKASETAAGAAATRAEAAAQKAADIAASVNLTEEHHTVTLTNTLAYPGNDSEDTVSLTVNRLKTDYTVDAHITGVKLPDGTAMNDDSTGIAGHVVLFDKALNGFKVKYTGAAKAATVELTVRGGM